MGDNFNLALFIKQEIYFMMYVLLLCSFWHCPKKNGSGRPSKNSRIFNASPHTAYARPLNIPANAQNEKIKHFISVLVGSSERDPTSTIKKHDFKRQTI